MPNAISSATDSGELFSKLVAVSDLRSKGRNPFEIALKAEALTSLAAHIGVDRIRKLRFTGEISAAGRTDWILTANLGVTLLQPCVVTLETVTTRIDQIITRHFIKDAEKEKDETDLEFDGQDDFEALESNIDIGAILIEALMLAVPEYPRSKDAALAKAAFSEPGVAPLQDADVKPFAGLAALKEKMQD